MYAAYPNAVGSKFQRAQRRQCLQTFNLADFILNKVERLQFGQRRDTFNLADRIEGQVEVSLHQKEVLALKTKKRPFPWDTSNWSTTRQQMGLDPSDYRTNPNPAVLCTQPTRPHS
jgi:hypothetical protein